MFVHHSVMKTAEAGLSPASRPFLMIKSGFNMKRRDSASGF
ncbi:hypothetical protein SeKA_B0044 (plasmid) [Salmonella enterica subsp. enterica serovar Kentucky str. CVM29188]|nr:hypothetical protein SeKA_B0044 [Salmonella enterica subsp. enterica serovar Kentucky str. CVM29188]